MSFHRPVPWALGALFATLLTASAPAQIAPGDMGMLLETKAGNAGSLCRGFTCVPHRAVVGTIETVQLHVRGPKDAAFWLFAAPVYDLCLPLAPFMNSLILRPPVVPLLGGTLSTQDSIRACPGGLQSLKFAIPLGPGVKFGMQALIMAQWQSGPLPTFSSVIEVTMR